MEKLLVDKLSWNKKLRFDKTQIYGYIKIVYTLEI